MTDVLQEEEKKTAETEVGRLQLMKYTELIRVFNISLRFYEILKLSLQ